ncbi:YggT family protein [bacterium]|nr:YggT family protein [bacterium]
MAKFILFLDRLVNYYLYFVVMGCFLSLVPNINPDYPLFHYIFLISGFYIIPPILGISFSPMIVMIILALISIGLKKIYLKYFYESEKDSEIIIMTPEEFINAQKEFERKRKDNNK